MIPSARRPRPFLSLALLLLVAAAARGELRDDVEGVIRKSEIGTAKVAVSVIEAGPGTVLVDRNAFARMIPASNQKLLTTGAALHTLGADFRFSTRLLKRGDELIVLGDGDPAFGDPALLELMTVDGRPGMDVNEFLAFWTDAVRAEGITRVERLVVDDRIFDREFVHPSWPHDQLNRRYCAQVSGLCFHLNQIFFYPVPRPNQRPDLSRMVPRCNALQPVNNATSRQGVHDDNTIWIARKHGTNEMSFYGNAKHAYRVPVPVTAHDMPDLFGRFLADRLRAAGVDVGSVGKSITGDIESAGEIIGPEVFTSIQTVIARCNRDSQNLFAECLLKRMGNAMTGQPGSWLNGAAIVRHVVHERLGAEARASRLFVADGSGLSRLNLIEPATLTAWLNSFHNDERLGAMFIESLAIGGATGTLENRLGTVEVEGAVVRAKSGYINGVSCLSGYVTASDGRRRCFSIMVNDLEVAVRRAKDLQDRIVAAIARDIVKSAVGLGSD